MSLIPVLRLYSQIIKKSEIAQTNKEKCEHLAQLCMCYSEVLKKINVDKINSEEIISQLRCFQLEALALVSEQSEEVCMNKVKNLFIPRDSIRKFNLMEERLKYAHDEFMLSVTIETCAMLQRNENLIERYHSELLTKLDNLIEQDRSNDAAFEYKYILEHDKSFFRHHISSKEYDSLIFAAEAMVAGDIDAERKELESIIQQNPESRIGCFLMGYLLCYKEKDTKGAKVAFKRSLEIEPKCLRAWNNLGRLLVTEKNFIDAEKAYRKSLKADIKHVSTWNDLGELYFKHLKDIVKAEASFKEALELDPLSARTWNNLGNILRKKDDVSGAIDLYKKALEFDPKYVRAWNNLGFLVSTKKKDIEGAKVFYEKALEIEPNNINACKNLGQLLRRDKKNLARARALFLKNTHLDPHDAEVWYNLGNVLKDIIDIEGSEAAYRKALDINSRYSKAWKNLGDLLNEFKQDIDGAATAYTEAVKYNPKYARAWFNLGFVLKVKNDGLGSEAAYKKALEIDPTISRSLKSIIEEKE